MHQHGILADVDADSEFKSSCGDTFNKMTINGTTVRYTSEVNKVAKCNIESTSQSIDVLCAKTLNTWYGDFYYHLNDNSNRHSSTLPQPQQIDADVPNLFLSAVWILGFGVLAHVFVRFSSLWQIAMYTHYVLMPIGVIIAIYAVALAKSESSSGVFEGSSHSIVGIIVLVLLCTNAILGIWHVAVGKRSLAAGIVHRTNGFVIIGLLVISHWSGTDKNGPIQYYDIKDSHISFYAWAACVPLIVTVAYILYVWNLLAQSSSYRRVPPETWDGTAPNLMKL